MSGSEFRQDVPVPGEVLRSLAGKTPDVEVFLKVGRDMMEDIVRFTGTERTASVLDIGCGTGRIARHFLDYIDSPGRYVGLDVLQEPVDWCRDNLSPLNPVFEFVHQDIANGMYNPNGAHQASEYRLPFEDDSFDLVILASVFTHMRPEDTENYLREISRVLKPGGSCFSTWVLLGRDIETVKYFGVQSPEGRVGYGIRYCLKLIEDCNLTLAMKPMLQRWKEERGSSFRRQDLLILKNGSNDDLLRQYEAPALPETPREESEVTGTISSVNPVEGLIHLTVGESERPFLLARGTRVRVNRSRADSSSLRPGQRVRLVFAHYPHVGNPAAIDVIARDHAESKAIAGRIAGVDIERGHLTIEDSEGFKTFEFSPESLKVHLEGEDAGLGSLEENRRVSLRYVPTITSVRIRKFE